MQRGPVALITGGCGGLGLAFARRWLERGGTKVRLVDFAPAAAGAAAVRSLEETFGAGTADFVRCDVTRTDELAAAFCREGDGGDGGDLGLVVNNAGIVNYSDDLFLDWRRQLDVNVGAVIDGTRLAADAFERQRESESGAADAAEADPVIVNVGSMAGLIPTPMMPVYTATKFSVVGFSRAMFVASRRKGYRVHALCPSFVDTGMINEERMTETPSTRRGVDLFGGLMTPDAVADALFTKVIDDPAAKCVLRITPHEGAAFDEPGMHPAEVPIRNALIKEDPIGFVKKLFGQKPPRRKKP